MAQYKTAVIEDTVYFWFAANDTSGSAGDGATPLADVRLAGAAASAIPTLSPTPDLLTHANYPAGLHEIAVAATVANGFAVNSEYAVFSTLAIDSQNPAGLVGSFELTPDGALSQMYAGGHGPGVWIDDAAGNTNTVVGVDGLESNPVSTIAAATTIATALSVKRFYLTNNTLITLAAGYDGYEFIGRGTGNQITLGSQDVDGSHFENLVMTGVQGGTGMVQIKGCSLTGLTGLEGWIENSLLTGNITVRAGTTTSFTACHSGIPGSGTPEMTFGAGVVSVAFRLYSGGLQINSMTADDTMSYDCPVGQFIIDATCTGGTLVARGNHTLTDNAGGAVTVTDDARIDVAQINNPTERTANADALLVRKTSDVEDSLTHGSVGQGLAARGGVHKVTHTDDLDNTGTVKVFKADGTTQIGSDMGVTTSPSADDITGIEDTA